MKDYFGKVISSYSDNQAEDDGILFPVKNHKIFSFITTNLMHGQGYMVRDGGEEHVNKANLTDLLHLAGGIVVRAYRKSGVQDRFYSGFIEFPSGTKGKIFIAQNESGKYTIMLPEDY